MFDFGIIAVSFSRYTRTWHIEFTHGVRGMERWGRLVIDQPDGTARIASSH